MNMDTQIKHREQISALADGQLADVLLKHEDGTLERPMAHAAPVDRTPANWPPLDA